MHNFSEAKQNAIEQMRQMNKKAIPPEELPPQNGHKIPKNASNNLMHTISSDDIIIIGLLVILSQDCRDMWLFLALMYILM